MKFFLRVGEDGAVKYGYLEDSTLGDGEAETCMLQVLTRATWPKPIGGEAEVRKSLGFDAPGDVRPPASWSSNEISPALVAHNAKLRACRGRAEGSFKATAYVIAGPPEAAPAPAKPGKRGKGPKPKKRPEAKPTGHILTMGIAPPNRDGLEAIECLVDALKQVPFPSPGSYPAKVTFSL